MRTCTRCGETKPLSEFHKGYSTRCKPCAREVAREHYYANREAKLAYGKLPEVMERARENARTRDRTTEQRNRQRAREAGYWERNRDRKAAISARYNAKPEVKAVSNARAANRRAMRAQATPAWCDNEIVLFMYATARLWGMHVDHITPIKSRLVCGLHTPDNMQLLPAKANLRKSNRWWPDMP